MDVEVTQRGFHRYGKPITTSYGHIISVYESSAAGSYVWLNVGGSVNVEPNSRDSRYNMEGGHVYEARGING